jgi:hypothetical protein
MNAGVKLLIAAFGPTSISEKQITTSDQSQFNVGSDSELFQPPAKLPRLRPDGEPKFFELTTGVMFPFNYGQLSSTIMHTYTDLPIKKGTKEVVEIPILNVDSLTLETIKKFLDIYKAEIDQQKIQEKESEWRKEQDENEFFEGLDQKNLADLVDAAYFLDISVLKDALELYYAKIINKCTSPEEMRDMLGLPSEDTKLGFQGTELQELIKQNKMLN